MDTIFALSTARGKAGVAIVRVSGTDAWKSAKILCPSLKETPRFAQYTDITFEGQIIDKALILLFKSPNSFTGEDIAEYHIHGGIAIIDALLEALASQPHHRMAEPGEFTRRAFENSKLDLTEAEAIADLIDAQTMLQKNQALSQLSGHLSAIYNDWTERLKRILAHTEAAIEFPDEDLPNEIPDQVKPQIEQIITELQHHLNDNRRGEILRDGVQIVILGAPNAGKSSLLNTLAQRDAAIVSDIAGTTRDMVEVHLNIAGIPATITDTAGLREIGDNAQGHDKIEGEGIRRAKEKAQNADLKILVFDGTLDKPDQDTLGLKDDNSLLIINKSDETPNFMLENALNISTKTGDGISDLLKAIEAKILPLIGNTETPSLTRKRHRIALENALEHLQNSCSAPLPELIAEDIRLSVREIGRITGRVDVEDMLDVIFRDFCIGK